MSQYENNKMRPGDVCVLNTDDGTQLGMVVVESVSERRDVIARLKLDSRHSALPQMRALLALARAADELAFAVVEQEELALTRMGLFLYSPGTRRRLVLGQDFCGLVISDSEQRIAFRLALGDELAAAEP